jgi:hypothetical protein
MPLFARDTTPAVSRRQEDFGLAERFFGRALTGFIFQITQRDVIYFVFLLLAIAGRASWILHIVFAFSVITLLFTSVQVGVGGWPRKYTGNGGR